MQLNIDNMQIVVQPGQSLLALVKQYALDSMKFSERPIAAKIAGEIFNLNYVPVRIKDVQNERQSIRRAMAASEGKVRLLRYEDPAGKNVYIRTAQFVVFLALHRFFGNRNIAS